MTMSAVVSVATIGFTKTTAQQFFERLSQSGIKKVIDVRLHNTSQSRDLRKHRISPTF
jgi:hypothetical protein